MPPDGTRGNPVRPDTIWPYRRRRDSPSGPGRARRARSWYRRLQPLVLVGALLGVAALTANQLLSEPDSSDAAVVLDDDVAGRTIHVAADADARGGDGSAGNPYGSIQRALVDALPGDEVLVGAGTYDEPVRSVRSGLPGKPIRLRGSDGARLVGDLDMDYLVELTHDDLELTGLHLSGANKLVWLVGTARVRIVGNTIENAGGECVRLRYHATANEIAHNTIRGCGQTGFDLGEDHKNGEGVYIGTAPEQLGKNPTSEPDTSSGNWVHDNRMDVPSECVDVKEHALGNIVEGNTCTGGQDPDGAGFSSRGQWTVFRDNVSRGHAGAGIRLGGDETSDGLHSDVRGNQLEGNRGYGVSVQRTPQYAICGNQVSDNGKGNSNTDEDPARPCQG